MAKTIFNKLDAKSAILKPATSIKADTKASVHFDACHFDIPDGGMGHTDIPHSDQNLGRSIREVRVKFTKINKTELVRFAKLGIKVDGKDLVVPSEKLSEFKKALTIKK